MYLRQPRVQLHGIAGHRKKPAQNILRRKIFFNRAVNFSPNLIRERDSPFAVLQIFQRNRALDKQIGNSSHTLRIAKQHRYPAVQRFFFRKPFQICNHIILYIDFPVFFRLSNLPDILRQIQLPFRAGFLCLLFINEFNHAFTSSALHICRPYLDMPRLII